MADKQRLYFRVIRTDEDVNEIYPKQRNPRKDKSMDQMVIEHIRYGSKPGFKSSVISMTAELYVALAWGGIVSRIVYTDLSEKKQNELKHLDKDYLRDFLTDSDVKNRSKRSDEILVFGSIKSAKLLEINITKVKRTLSPGFEDADRDYFPTEAEDLFNDLKTVRSIAGANKRLFEVQIDNRSWIAFLPRPNHSLEEVVYMNDKLVEVCAHHFNCFCCYRYLTNHIPRCAMYTFDFHYVNHDMLPKSVTYKWAFILLEHLILTDGSSDQKDRFITAARNSFMADVILGNWNCLDGQTDRSKPSQTVFGVTSEFGSIVKLAVDRSLGCIYPEDRDKEDKMKVSFDGKNCDSLITKLQAKYQWCYGLIDRKEIMQQIMDLKLNGKNLFYLKDCLSSAKWPPWTSVQKYSLWDILKKRIETMMNKIPFYIIQNPFIESSDKPNPSARDGHGAVVIGNTMYVAGGNSNNGPLNDLWQYNYEICEWKELKAFPAPARFSFSMHVWQNKYIIIFGGCPGENKSRKMLNDLMLYDIENDYWEMVDSVNTWPGPRCRQGSNLITDCNDANLYIFGGFTNRKLDDLWKGTITFNDTKCVCTWQMLQKLERPIHRCESFDINGRIFLVGGFGRSLMKLQEVGGQQTVITTHDLLDLPLSEKEAFLESKSLAGFGAVYDELGKRLIVVGGGNIGKKGKKGKNKKRNTNEGTTRNQSFGTNAPADVNIKPRILYLNHGTDEKGRDEWKWQTNDAYELLDSHHKLPHLTSWSACYIEMDHSVLLFGGRNDTLFSKDLYKLQLRPEYVISLDKIKNKAITLNTAVVEACEQWKDPSQQQRIIDSARDHLESLISFQSGEKNHPNLSSSPLRILTLNVHGFRNTTNDEFIDDHISNLLEMYQPDLACLQEVKHPFPSNPGTRIVQLDHSKLFRYFDNRPVSDIMRLLSLKDESKRSIFEHELTNSSARPPKFPKLPNGACVINEPPSVLDKLASYINGKFNFSPALDTTFGNAIISLKSECRFKEILLNLNITGVENRSASIATILHNRNWSFSVINIHLDVNDETIRLQQINKLLSQLCFKNINDQAQYPVTIPHILCGDFNAYSHWSQSIEEYCQSQGYEPTDKLYKILTVDMGYIDLESHLPPRDTSAYGVRVDYVLASKSLAVRLISHKLYVVPTMSDHEGLLASLTFNEKKVLVGMTGLMIPDQVLQHFKQQVQVGNTNCLRIIIIEMHRYNRKQLNNESTESYDLNLCFSEIIQGLYKFDIVIVVGQHLNFLLPCMDMLFIILQSKQNYCYRFFKIEYQNAVDDPKKYWKNYVLPSWKLQNDHYMLQKAKNFKKIKEIDIDAKEVGGYIIDEIKNYIMQ